MVKVIFLLTFRRDLDREEVSKWWRTDHGALALKNTGTTGRRRSQPSTPRGHALQGCVEVWFDNMEDYEATMASPEWQALEADGVNGFDMAELHGVSSPST
jgi:uncharacterized protein (TIGR02118 family)